MEKRKSSKKLPKNQWLSKKEHDVITLIKAGYKNKQICEILSLNQRTVSTYVTKVYRKFDFDKTKNVYWLINKLEKMDKLKQ